MLLCSVFNYFNFTPKPSNLSVFPLRSLSLLLLPPITKPTNHPTPTTTKWNTTHKFVLSKPPLFLLETKCRSISQLKQIQSQMIVTGLALDSLAYSRLVTFSALSQNSDLDYSKRLLLAMPNSNLYSWNVVIRAFCESQYPSDAFALYKKMLVFVSLRPDNYTFPLLIKVCAKLLLSHLGNGIIGHVVKMNYCNDIYVRNALIHFFACCGELEAAHELFDESCLRDLVSWNSLINGYVKSGRGKEALSVYSRMEMEMEVERSVVPNEITMIGVVMACTQVEDVARGREVHRYIRDRGLKISFHLANALLDMYVKCGDLESAIELFERMEEKTKVTWTTMVVRCAKFGYLDVARRVFDAMPEKDVVPWNAMLSAYVQARRGNEALLLFHEMQTVKVKPDEVTMVNCLSACAQLGALHFGKWIHCCIEKHSLCMNVVLGTALVDMYAKCGNITKALEVFHELPSRNALTYTAVIGGLALHGDARDALSCFHKMIRASLVPDEVTFLGVLAACCHRGLVEEGREIFLLMHSKFNVPPKVEHYACMVDLLGRAGLLKEAVELVESMPMEADVVVWGAMFFACRKHTDIELAERAATKLLQLVPNDSGIYFSIASMYDERNMCQKADEVRKMMRAREVYKTPGCSSIVVDEYLYEFVVGDKSHPQYDQIYECLVRLSKQMGPVECIAQSCSCIMFTTGV